MNAFLVVLNPPALPPGLHLTVVSVLYLAHVGVTNKIANEIAIPITQRPPLRQRSPVKTCSKPHQNLIKT